MHTKELPTSALLGLASSICTSGGFSPIHEAAEWVAGHPIWTHEFADREFVKRLQRAVMLQVPEISSWCSKIKDHGGKWAEIEAECIAAIGPTFTITQGCAERTESPLESLERIAPGVPVITLVKED